MQRFFVLFLVIGLKCEQCIHQNIAMKVSADSCKLEQSGSGRGIGYPNLGLYGNQITIPDYPNSRYKLSESEA